MLDKKNTLELLSYINTPMSKESINVLYTANNIRYERCQLYNDFIQSLILLVFDTYLGDEITDKQEQRNHFKWCWDKNIENFSRENIHIESPKLFSYYMDFMLEVYYPITNKLENKAVHRNILNLWTYVFNYTNKKTKSDMDTLIEVYKLFDQAVKSK